MSAKFRGIVLNRLRAGDQDILVKIYAQCGVADLFIKDALLPESHYRGVFEPFNLVEFYATEKGGILFPNDIIRVEYISRLAFEYERFLWMSKLTIFFISRIKYFEEELFNLLLYNLINFPRKNRDIAFLKFKLEVIKVLGFMPKFLLRKKFPKTIKISLENGDISENGDIDMPAGSIKLLKKIYEFRDIDKIKADKTVLNAADRFIDRYIEFHLTK